jgi:hypothetical protein
MPGRDVDPRIVYEGLMAGELTTHQAAALFREDKGRAQAYLGYALTDTLNDPRHKDSTHLKCPAGRFLQTYWLFFGPYESVLMLSLHRVPVVEAFFRQKLTVALNEFSDEDMKLLESRYRDTEMHKVVVAARARRLRPLANTLLKNPAELNIDIAEVKNRVGAYNFNPELNEVLDKVEVELATSGDGFDQAAMLKHLRTFYEKLHEQAAQKLRAEKIPQSVDGTDLSQCQQAIDYLHRHGVLTDRMRQFGRALYGVLSEEGVHAFKSEREYVRLCRNMIGEYALVVLFELERRLRA